MPECLSVSLHSVAVSVLACSGVCGECGCRGILGMFSGPVIPWLCNDGDEVAAEAYPCEQSWVCYGSGRDWRDGVSVCNWCYCGGERGQGVAAYYSGIDFGGGNHVVEFPKDQEEGVG